MPLSRCRSLAFRSSLSLSVSRLCPPSLDDRRVSPFSSEASLSARTCRRFSCRRRSLVSCVELFRSEGVIERGLVSCGRSSFLSSSLDLVSLLSLTPSLSFSSRRDLLDRSLALLSTLPLLCVLAGVGEAFRDEVGVLARDDSGVGLGALAAGAVGRRGFEITPNFLARAAARSSSTESDAGGPIDPVRCAAGAVVEIDRDEPVCVGPFRVEPAGPVGAIGRLAVDLVARGPAGGVAAASLSFESSTGGVAARAASAGKPGAVLLQCKGTRFDHHAIDLLWFVLDPSTGLLLFQSRSESLGITTARRSSGRCSLPVTGLLSISIRCNLSCRGSRGCGYGFGWPRGD